MEEAVPGSGGGIRSVLPLGSLISPSGTEVQLPELEGKIIGLYFAANWHPKCEAFTPALAAAYHQLKARGAGFEVLFVSCDEDRPSFERFHRGMPWPAVPFGDLRCKKSLSEAFQVEGIPRLVVLAPGGSEVICSDAVELVHRYGDPAFPFTPARVAELEADEQSKFASQTLEKLFSVSYVNGSNQQVPISSLVGKTVGLYFSAHRCAPCVKFTARLAAIYGTLKGKAEEFEIVYVPMDKEEEGYLRSCGDMPWLALPYDADGASSRALARYFDVREIPTLVVIGPDGKTVTREGRNLVNLYFDMAFPFTDEQIRLLQELEDEDAKGYAPSLRHTGHRHELSIVSGKSGGGPYICCECDEQGSGWAYQCIACGYEIHLRCGRDVEGGSAGAG